MIAAELLRQQRLLTPRGDLNAYAGQWIAVRNAEVILWAASLTELVGQAGYRQEDGVMYVPEAPTGILI